MSLQNKDPINLIIAGVGGQGNVTISRLIGQAMVDTGYAVMVGETFGAAQRGGSVASYVRISKDTLYSPLVPTGQAHVILGLEPMEAIRNLALYGNPETDIIINTRPVYPPNVATGEVDYPSLENIQSSVKELAKKAWYLDATGIALTLGNSLLTNIVMMGALVYTKLTPLTEEMFTRQLEANFSGERLNSNLRAFKMGLENKF
jgi:indolepyruvate ferredoxin oxidoreductase beta subunit